MERKRKLEMPVKTGIEVPVVSDSFRMGCLAGQAQ